MDAKFFPAFIDEAMRQLPGIRGALLLYSQAGRTTTDFQAPRTAIGSIAESAKMLGLAEINELAVSIGQQIGQIEQLRPGGHEYARTALDLLAKLEATLLKISLDDENFSLDIDDFIDESFGLLQVNDRSPSMIEIASPAEPKTEDTWETEAGDEFEIDPELLEIFGEEAEGLLKNIETSLEALARNPHDSESLWEIRRNAHTFKGSAGIVGLKQLSEVAHRVEDLLDRLAETNNSSNQRIFEVLHSSTACLRALTNGESSKELLDNIAQLYGAFDGVVASLDGSQAAEVEEVLPMPVEAVTVDPIKSLDLIAPTLPIEKVFAVVTNDQILSKAPQSKAVVRVSLGRLDELVTIVRDMILSRSVFEEHLKSLDRQIDELHNATRRLQSNSTKLEVDFEASLMGSGNSNFLNLGGGVHSQPVAQHDGFDELEFDQYTEFHQSTRELAETASDTFAITTELDLLRGNFETLFEQQRRIVEDLQEKLMRIRMVEFGSLATRLQRAVRVTCDEEDKKAQIRIENETLQIDTQILDSLIEPLIHLLKNAVVHGIEDPETRRLLGKPEQGLIEVSVHNEETHILLNVSDDGAGIGLSALRNKAIASGFLTEEQAAALSEEETFDLVFLPGLTTAEKLNLSAGRGVGMSIVKESIVACRGTISIDSTPQKGTTFSVRMPLTLAITRVLLIRCAGRTYAVPFKQIDHVSEITGEMLSAEQDRINIRGEQMPLLHLSGFLDGGAGEGIEPSEMTAIVSTSGKKSSALAVDDVVRAEEVVIKPLGRQLSGIKGILGAAILGDGELVPILDLPGLLKRKTKKKQIETAEPPVKTVTILIVDDSPSVRHMTSKVVQAAGWQVRMAKDGIEAIEQLKTMPDPPAVILSDIEMPRMDGFELAASLQRYEEFKSIPVIMITSRSADKHREKALENGVSQYLTKPYEDKELIDSIKNLAKITS